MHGDDQKQRFIPRQLPADISAFVNRKPELRTLTRLIAAKSGGSASRSRERPATVVVITGSAGVGKTALALHWAHRIRERFPDGEIYANLHGYDEVSPVSAEIAAERILRDLGIPPHLIPRDLDGRAGLFRTLVADRRVLIVLDNVSDVGQVRPLIPGGPGPLLIVTSRNQLSGLVIRDGARRVHLDILQETDSIALLRRVTRTGNRHDQASDLTELARLCANLPLALRIAGERAAAHPMMELVELIADLRDDSMLWEALSIGIEPDREAVRTVFAWSYRDLSGDAARMFRALGLHQGPDVSLAVAAAAIGVPVRLARQALDVLLGAFLVETAQPGRYQLHDLLRAYALDQARTIDSALDRRMVIDRIQRWYIATASNAAQALAPGDRSAMDIPTPDGPAPIRFDDSATALDWFETERQNLIANARFALSSGLPRRAWELAMALSPIHTQHFAFDDWASLSEIAVEAAERAGDQRDLASALDNRGKYLFRTGSLLEAREVHTRALAIREDIDDKRGICQSLNALGLVGLRARELSDAAGYFQRVATTAQAVGDRRWEGLGLSNFVEARLELSEAADVIETVQRLPTLFSDISDPASEGNALWLLCWAHRLLGDLPAALASIDRAMSIAENASNRMWEAFWLIEAARVRLLTGEQGEAMRCCRIAASLERQIGDSGREAMALDCTGEVLQAAGNATDAVAFHKEAGRMFHGLDDTWHEALALVHLGAAEGTLGHGEQRLNHLTQAIDRLRPFTDSRALRLRHDVQELLDGSGL